MRPPARSLADALVYRAEGAAVAHGTDLYGFTVTEWRLPATYPPFAALLFVPAAWLAPAALKVAFVLGNAVLLAVLVRLSCRLAGLAARLPAVCAATALTLWLEPVFQSVLFGQINLALVCLVLWDLTRPPGAPGKGVAVGIAAGVKLTPVAFIAYLLFTGRRREAGTAVGTFAGTVLLGALVLPAASVDFWTRRLYETGRVGKPWIVDDQSPQGLIARALGEPSPGRPGSCRPSSSAARASGCPAPAPPPPPASGVRTPSSCTRPGPGARRRSPTRRRPGTRRRLRTSRGPRARGRPPGTWRRPRIRGGPGARGRPRTSRRPRTWRRSVPGRGPARRRGPARLHDRARGEDHVRVADHPRVEDHLRVAGNPGAGTTYAPDRALAYAGRTAPHAGRSAPATGPHPDRWGVLGTAFTALLVSPISWSHHWVWCVPLIAVLYAGHGPRPAAAVAAVFTARTLWLIPHQGDLDLRLPWWQQPLASPYPLLGLLVLAQLSASSSSASRIR